MSDLFLIAVIPLSIVAVVLVVKIFEVFVVDCTHEYDEWQHWVTDHAYVQQKQCKKCKYIFTYQERKIGHDSH